YPSQRQVRVRVQAGQPLARGRRDRRERLRHPSQVPAVRPAREQCRSGAHRLGLRRPADPERGRPLLDLRVARSGRPGLRCELGRRTLVHVPPLGVPAVTPCRARSFTMKRIAAAVATLGLLVALTGCFNPFAPNVLSQRVTSAAPTPNSPQNAVKLFEWCWVNRGVDEYRELFTDDYVFISAGKDSAGNPSREIQARRDDEVLIAEN